MSLVLDDCLVSFRRSQDYSELQNHGISLKSVSGKLSDHHVISWAEHVLGVRHSCLETGFFKNALHLDTVGLYQECSLNFPSAIREIERYEAHESWKGLSLHPKFGQPSEPVEWAGIVVALQYANDRSILRAGPVSRYYRFVEDVCSQFGKKAFLKVHPCIIGDPSALKVVHDIALKYGCEIGHVSTSVIDKAEAVFTYNSCFTVDALMRGKHVVQYAPGYFWQTGAVQYTGGEIPSKFIPIKDGFADKFLDFLVWKYCWDERMPMSEIATIMKCFASSKEMFPLPTELSYGGFATR